ncbi:hypothetical protein L226DRAFT_561285 [Lentinus tigrinus ALCF2SS1-7]|uniref:Uncharacterized protein n=1 Tax=Lentinus tigrinus ALCF2SS1-6 TaxID=1328759 RepID=A0A5C2S867_9APHY|nr:hypothetical protein L227DRAFT_601578 [Lentinus tigrinus ALCF2SS1-6]RPD73600.1 hypothetical protein L226DRAFT_561285 [Lentinus tigrinus ALCF2SS1-7]
MANFEFSWAIFTGVFSIVVVIPGSLLYIHSQLPSQKLRPMFETLTEAEELLLSCTEEGLVYGAKAEGFRSKLDQLRHRAERARFEAHTARTYAEDVANWVKGLSRKIHEICSKVRDVRADISTNSLRERERQAALRDQHTATENGESGNPELTVSAASSPVASEDGVLVGGDADTKGGTAQLHNLADIPQSPESQSDEIAADCKLPTTPSLGHATDLEKPSSLSMATPQSIESLRKVAQSDRRCSISSGSSGTSLLQSMRRKKRGGDPLSRARAMTRFVRQARAMRSLPAFTVHSRRLAAFEFAESDSDGDDDDEWIDEQAIRVLLEAARSASRLPTSR